MADLRIASLPSITCILHGYSKSDDQSLLNIFQLILNVKFTIVTAYTRNSPIKLAQK